MRAVNEGRTVTEANCNGTQIARNKEKDLEIGLQREEDEGELLSFYEEFHEQGREIASFYQWRQKENTVLGKGRDFVVRYQGRIVGALGISPVVHTCKGNKIVVHWLRDALISPLMRGKGLGKKLLKAVSEEFDMGLGKGSNDNMYKVFKKSEWRDAPNSDYMALVLECWPREKDWKTKMAHVFLFVWGSVLSHAYCARSISCQEIKRFGKDFDSLAERCAKSGVFGIYKTSSYLNWRYFDCPGRSYTVLKVGDKVTEGAVVIKLPSRKSQEAWIIDVLGESNNKEIIRELITEALDVIKNRGAGKLLVFSTSSRVRQILRRFGFVNIRKSPRFTFIMKPGSRLEDVTRGADWNFWHGDSDNELYE